MEILAYVALLCWLPASLGLFGSMPPRRAVVKALIVAWLFLPVLAIPLSGLPDLTKASATLLGLLLGIFAFDCRRLIAIRPRWTDLPILMWCVAPFLSSIANGLGPYDGVSGVITHTVTWGLPYLIGRVYLDEPDALKELAIGIVAGGVAYAPLCILEILFSPQLHRIVYGFAPSSFVQTLRYGGYRPQVFMLHGLELGMWMTAASLLGWYLWARGDLRRLWGLPFGSVLLPGLIVTTFLCKSTGSLVLLGVGMGILWLSRRTKTYVFVIVLLTIAPLYMIVRCGGIWDGRAVVEYSDRLMGGDRAQSLEFRLSNEDLLIGRALQQPLFGWAGWGRALVFQEEIQQNTITDGLWIIALGNYGLFGLISVTATTLMPLRLLIGRAGTRSWNEPSFAPIAGLSVLLGLFTVDNISNAMYNPIWILAAGGLASLNRRQIRGEEPALKLSDEANEALTRAIDLDHEAGSHRLGEESGVELDLDSHGVLAWSKALGALREEFGETPEPAEHRRLLAFGLQRLADHLASLGRDAEALDARVEAIELRSSLIEETDASHDAAILWAGVVNDTAWLVANSLDMSVRDPDWAIELAGSVVACFPDVPAYWNTLGAAYLRAGEWSSATVAIGRSIAINRGRTPYDGLLMALVHLGRGDAEGAREWFDRSDELIGSDPSHALTSLRDEVRSFLPRRLC